MSVYIFHTGLRCSSPLKPLTWFTAVELYNVEVSITGEDLVRDICVFERNWWTNSVEGNTPLQELFTSHFYERYFLLEWKWWISFVCGNFWTFIVRGPGVQDTLVGIADNWLEAKWKFCVKSLLDTMTPGSESLTQFKLWWTGKINSCSFKCICKLYLHKRIQSPSSSTPTFIKS